jgi:hypothetical protein
VPPLAEVEVACPARGRCLALLLGGFALGLDV